MLHFYLIFALLLYLLGLYTMASSKNMVKLVVNLNFIALAAFTTGPDVIGPVDPLVQNFVIISICIGGAIAVVAMSLIVKAYRHYGTLDIRELRRLHG